MNRLTNKKVLDEMYKFPKDYTFSTEELIYNKLGKFEDIEELCEQIEKGKPVYRKLDSGKIYHDCYSNYNITYSFIKRSIVLHDYDCPITFYFNIDEYGKTWALTKKELEK